MIIEMSGASGVGKSTCLSNISKTAFSEYQVASGSILSDLMREVKAKSGPLFFLKEADHNPVFIDSDFISQYIFRVIHLSAADSQKLNLFKFINNHRQDFLIRKEVNAKHLLVDEGLIHASFPLSQFSTNLEDDIEFFISNIPLPDLVVQIHASPDKILKRIKARGKVVNSYLYANEEELLNRLSRVETYLNLMEKVLQRRGCRVKHIDANGPVIQWSQELLNLVRDETSRHAESSDEVRMLNLNFSTTTGKQDIPASLNAIELPDRPLKFDFFHPNECRAEQP